MQKMYDMSSPVLVTGATGYVAGWIVKLLLNEGVTVHAAVRDPLDLEKLKYLNAIADSAPGKIEFFEANLLSPGSYSEAMTGCAVVYHTASPFTLSVKDPKRDLIDPALLGTRNVLYQANEIDSVKRIVVTSSCAAVYADNIDMKRARLDALDEQNWNTSSSLEYQPYSYSKVLAEKAAWEISRKQDQWELVVTNPSLVIGPGINPFATSESFSLIKQFGDGTMRAGSLSLPLGSVDVRDVAEAHLRAGFMPDAKGRYIISGHNTNLEEIGCILREHYGNGYPFPSNTVPKLLAWAVGPLVDRTTNRQMIGRNVDYPLRLDNSKSVEELSMQYRPLNESVIEMFQQLVDANLLSR